MGLFDKEEKFKVANGPKLFKYYLEVIGGEKELYTVKANDMNISQYGCYTFELDGKIIASYPIARTIVKSIEEKTNEQV